MTNSKKIKYILALETSCDETASSIIRLNSKEAQILSNIISSQINTHKKYGGVVPEVASRMHLEKISEIIKKALKQAKIKIDQINYIAVTKEPGLVGSLMIGVTAAKTLALALNIPLIEINHIYGHFCSPLIEKDKLIFKNLQKKVPAISLLVSGGHTQLVYSKDFLKYKVVGETVDDASGEAFDKAAKILGLGYPGGPAISACADKIKDQKLNIKNLENYTLPVPMKDSKDFNFSFSGLKTALLYKTIKHKKLSEKDKVAFAYSFQKSLTDSLVLKTISTIKKYKPKTVFLAGGVAANTCLREKLAKAIFDNFKEIEYKIPDFKYCTDNAAMIGIAAALKLKAKKK